MIPGTHLAAASLALCLGAATVTSQETRPSAEDRLARARVEYARGDYPAAERSLEEALALAPGDARIHLMLGALHLRVRRFEGAARAFERGLALDPSEISRCPWVGHAYHELGDLEKARAWYGRVLEAAPENLEAKRGLALTLFKRGESQDAERLYRELRESAPAGSKARADAHRFLGEILLERGEAQAAALELLLAKAQSRFDPEIAYALSRAYAAAGDPARAEEERKAHEKLSRHRSGLEAMQARLRSNPRDREAWLGAASHLEEMGDGEEAEGTLRRAAALLPGDPAPRLALVDRFEKTSRKAEARALLEEAALLFPESPEVFERAFRFHRAAGDFEAMVQAAEAYYRLTGRPPR